MAKLLFYPSLQDGVLNVTPIQIVIKHLFFSVRREEVITINDTLSNFMKGGHSASIPSLAKLARTPSIVWVLNARVGAVPANHQRTYYRLTPRSMILHR
jgi:hypothetical protein